MFAFFENILMKQELKRARIKRMRWRCMSKSWYRSLQLKKKVKTVYDLGINGSKRMGRGHSGDRASLTSPCLGIWVLFFLRIIRSLWWAEEYSLFQGNAISKNI